MDRRHRYLRLIRGESRGPLAAGGAGSGLASRRAAAGRIGARRRPSAIAPYDRGWTADPAVPRSPSSRSAT